MAKIVETNWGVANTYTINDKSVIEINSNLNHFPKLREKIIRHELEHAKSDSWIANRRVDISTKIKFKDLLPFYKKHPWCFFQQNFPVNYSKNKNTLYFEWSLILLYIFFGGVIFGVYKLIGDLYSSSSQMFFQIIKYIVILFGIIGVLYFLKRWIQKKTSTQ